MGHVMASVMRQNENYGTADFLPDPRSGHRCVFICGAVLVCGGYNAEKNNTVYQEICAYDVYRKRWRRLPNSDFFPQEAASFSAVVLENNIVFYGGTAYPFSRQNSMKLTLYSMSFKFGPSLTQLHSENGPMAKYGHAMWQYDNYAYVYGGTLGNVYVDEMHRFNLTTLHWDVVPQLGGRPASRYRHEVAVYKDDVFVLGGSDSTEVFSLRDLPVFNMTKGTWNTVRTTSKSGFPAARYAHACVTFGDMAYVSGGLDLNMGALSDIWRLDLRSRTWTEMAGLPNPLYFHSATVSSAGCMYVFGGVLGHTNVRTNTLLEFWLVPPPLRMLSWWRLLGSYPQLRDMSTEELIDWGLPRGLVLQLSYVQGLL